MEIKDMTLADIETRAKEIESADITADNVEELTAELEQMEARKKEIVEEAEKRKAMLNEIAMTSVEVETTRKDLEMGKEFRDTQAYIDAYANYIKTGNDRECRTLMTENNTNGTLPVPTFVADIVAEAFRRSEIVDGFRKMNAKGNVRVPVEIDAPPAAIHTEGGAAINEEALEIQNVLLEPLTYKKWVGITDEALDIELMSSRSYLEYVFDEIARGILKAREAKFVTVLSNDNVLTLHGTFTTPAAADFINARAALNPEAARDAVIITTPAILAQYKALQLSAQYPIDIFDGMRVLLTTADLEGFIVGDLRGYMENLPKGEEIQFKKDDITQMTSDVVRVLGRLPASVGVVGYHYFKVVIAEGA